MLAWARSLGATAASRLPRAGRALGNRAQAGGSNLVSLFIGVMIAAVIAIQVVIPVINDALASSNVTGITATILGLVTTFIGLLLLISVASPLMRRV